MRPPFLRINALTRADRHQMIPALRDAINGSGGWITDFKFFSNTSVCLNFELPLRHLGRFSSAVKALHLSLSGQSECDIEDCRTLAEQAGAESGEAEVRGTLQVTFIHNEPELRIEVPPIRG